MAGDLNWDFPLDHGKGAPSNMLGIDLFFDFDWIEVVGHPQMQFPNGLCLARRVLRECPDDKEPALLLTNREEEERSSFETDRFYVVVVNFLDIWTKQTPTSPLLTSETLLALD